MKPKLNTNELIFKTVQKQEHNTTNSQLRHTFPSSSFFYSFANQNSFRVSERGTDDGFSFRMNRCRENDSTTHSSKQFSFLNESVSERIVWIEWIPHKDSNLTPPTVNERLCITKAQIDSLSVTCQHRQAWYKQPQCSLKEH